MTEKSLISEKQKETLAKRLEGWSYPRLTALTVLSGILALIPDIPLFWVDEAFFGGIAAFLVRVLIGKTINRTPTKKE